MSQDSKTASRLDFSWPPGTGRRLQYFLNKPQTTLEILNVSNSVRDPGFEEIMEKVVTSRGNADFQSLHDLIGASEKGKVARWIADLYDEVRAVRPGTLVQQQEEEGEPAVQDEPRRDSRKRSNAVYARPDTGPAAPTLTIDIGGGADPAAASALYVIFPVTTSSVPAASTQNYSINVK